MPNFCQQNQKNCLIYIYSTNEKNAERRSDLLKEIMTKYNNVFPPFGWENKCNTSPI